MPYGFIGEHIGRTQYRWVTDLKAAGGMYYSAHEVNPQGDFEIEVEFYRNNGVGIGGQFIYCEQNSTTQDYGLNFYAEGDFDSGAGTVSLFRASGGTVSVSGLQAGTVNKIVLSKVGSSMFLQLNNLAKTEFTNRSLSNTSCDAARFGSRATGSFYLSGGLFSTKIWNGGDRSTGTLVRDYRFDDNDGVLVDYSGNNANGSRVNVTAAERELMTFDSVRTAWVGQELITQQVWENPIGAGYVWSFSDNKWSMIGDGTFSSLDLIPISNLPATALLTGEILDMNGSNQLTVTQEGSQPITSIGSYELLFNLKVHKNYQYKRFGGVMNATISKPSFKRIIKVAQ